jgi:hypothetical protein
VLCTFKQDTVIPTGRGNPHIAMKGTLPDSFLHQPLTLRTICGSQTHKTPTINGTLDSQPSSLAYSKPCSSGLPLQASESSSWALVPLNISASLKLLRHIKGHNKTQLSLWRSESKHYLKFQNHTAILSWASDSISWSSPSGSNGNLLEHAVSCHASTATSLTYLYFSLVYVNIQRLHCNTSICANFVL